MLPAALRCDHAALRAPAIWRNLPYVGIQGDLEIRNCSACGSSLSRPVHRLLRITALGSSLYLIEHTGGRALYREVGDRVSTLERADWREEIRHEAHDALDADLFLMASEVICDGRRVPGCEVS